MTPNELQKQLTDILVEPLSDKGFRKKRMGTFGRTVGECEQGFSFYFTRDRGLPGNAYSLTCTLSFCYEKLDKLTCEIMGIDYDSKWATGAVPLYTRLPGKNSTWAKYVCGESLEAYAQAVAESFASFALPFYESINSMEKLANHFEKHPNYSNDGSDFRVVRNHARACCIAAVIGISQGHAEMQNFAAGSDAITDTQRENILKIIQG